jgi:transketolase
MVHARTHAWTAVLPICESRPEPGLAAPVFANAQFNRDRFILSNGHACALLYTMLHLAGYDMPMEELKNFRQIGSVTAGHPENELHAAIEATTGPLGQGITQGVGMAISERHLAATYNKDGSKIIDNTIYVICGDGCLQEGVSAEASSLAGHLGLGNLIVLYDDNHITIDGSTDLSFTEDVGARYAAYGWQVLEVADGNSDLAGIEAAIREGQADTERPTMIKVRTSIGFGSSKADSEAAHGAPLGDAVIAEAKRGFGMDPDATFVIDDDVRAAYTGAIETGTAAEAEWNAALEAYAAAHPEEGAILKRRIAGDIPADIIDKLPRFTASDKADATRNLSGVVLNALATALPELIGGSADLTPSNKTLLKTSGDFQKATPAGRYFRFGVREHAMTAICNGMCGYGGMIPYAGTFLNFIGYAAGAVRVSAISGFRVIFVATHDSIALGEDGPTHQPIEMLLMLRGMPNMHVYRPADGNETSAAYASALAHPTTPAVIALTRQNLPQLAESSIEKGMKGGYTVYDTAGMGSAGPADIIIAGTGSEVSLAMEAADKVAAEATKRVQVVSFPCLELFEAQGAEYVKTVLTEGTPVVSVEALCTLGWERYAHASVGVDRFGLSGPGPAVYEALGITSEAVKAKAIALSARFAAGAAPLLPVHTRL